MYSTFRVKKGTGTYSDTIEAFGLANLLNEIQNRAELSRPKLWIEDVGPYYQLSINPEITEDIINDIDYFPLFKWAIGKEGEHFDDVFFDYPLQKRLKKEKQEEIARITKEYSGKDNAARRQNELKLLENVYLREKRIDEELDVYQQFLEGKPNIKQSFEKLYNNFKNFDRKSFHDLLIYILDYYSKGQSSDSKIDAQSSFVHKITSGQILSPTDGLGLLKDKANGLSESKPNRNWVCETMKISGALSNMHCKLVKITDKSWDLKVVVPDFVKAQYQTQKNIVKSFKRNVKGKTPIKTDILNLLILSQKIIENSESFKEFNARNIVSGIFSVYQKDMGNNKSIANISKLQTPSFIEFDNEDEAKDWIVVIQEFIRIVSKSIDEKEDAATGAIEGLISLRNFISNSHFQSWMKFSYWYSSHLMLKLSKNKDALSFKVSSLNKFLKTIIMNDFKISEIISNDGFQKVATAIRNSTVILQGAKSRGQKIDFEIRYGTAQELQNKSRTSIDLAAFIGDFIGIYNAETVRKAEINKAYRKSVRDNELNDFYGLLDKYPSKVVGALLSSYGFALTEKGNENLDDSPELENEETE
jgi:hypothetical protein